MGRFFSNFDFSPSKIARNRPIVTWICSWKSRKILLFFPRNIRSPAEKLEEQALVYYMQCKQCPEAVRSLKHKSKNSDPLKLLIISSTARQGVITSIHTMLKFLLTEITPSSTTSRRPAIAITLYRWSSRDSNKIFNFVSNCFALNSENYFIC